MSKTITAEQIRAAFESTIEDTRTPDRFLAYLAMKDGKKLTARDLPHLKQIDPDAYIGNIARMAQLEWGGYGRARGERGGSLLIAYCEGAPTIDVKWIEENNQAYFGAARKRNETRRMVLATATEVRKNGLDVFHEAAEAINAIHAAKAKLAKIMNDYQAPLSDGRYAIRKLVKEQLDLDID